MARGKGEGSVYLAKSGLWTAAVALAVVMSVLTSLADPDRTDVAITTGGRHTA